MADALSIGAEMRLHTPEKVWLEFHLDQDACDVLISMDDGTVYTALFATAEYLQRQMDLNFQVTQEMADTPPVRYCVIDTPHILVDELTRDIIEDTIDNFIALDVFECLFTRVTDLNEKTASVRTINDGERTTQEVAAVVISDVLVIRE